MTNLPKMRKGKFDVYVGEENGHPRYQIVSGYIFSWKHEEFGVFKDPRGWVVVEIRTGNYCREPGVFPDESIYFKTRREAVESEIKVMEKIGADVVRETIDFELYERAHPEHGNAVEYPDPLEPLRNKRRSERSLAEWLILHVLRCPIDYTIYNVIKDAEESRKDNKELPRFQRTDNGCYYDSCLECWSEFRKTVITEVKKSLDKLEEIENNPDLREEVELTSNNKSDILIRTKKNNK